jgi:hypothetical protein
MGERGPTLDPGRRPWLERWRRPAAGGGRGAGRRLGRAGGKATAGIDCGGRAVSSALPPDLKVSSPPPSV